eukprot:gene18872-biopygen23449
MWCETLAPEGEFPTWPGQLVTWSGEGRRRHFAESARAKAAGVVQASCRAPAGRHPGVPAGRHPGVPAGECPFVGQDVAGRTQQSTCNSLRPKGRTFWSSRARYSYTRTGVL